MVISRDTALAMLQHPNHFGNFTVISGEEIWTTILKLHNRVDELESQLADAQMRILRDETHSPHIHYGSEASYHHEMQTLQNEREQLRKEGHL